MTAKGLVVRVTGVFPQAIVQSCPGDLRRRTLSVGGVGAFSVAYEWGSRAFTRPSTDGRSELGRSRVLTHDRPSRRRTRSIPTRRVR